MTRTRRLAAAYIALAAAVAVLFALNLFWGSVSLAPGAVLTALLGKGGDALAGNIILQLRLPRAVMAALLGAALSAAGYLLQTFFANPIAGPFVMGVSSGAKLAVALTMVVFLDRGMLTSSATMIAAAFAGAMAAMAFVLAVARRVQRMSILVICGVMIGYICSAVTDIVVAFAQDSNIVNLHNWSQGSFSGMTWGNVRAAALVVLPVLVVNDLGMGDPFFCKYVCPQGVLEGAIPLSLTNAPIHAALGKLFSWKLCVLITVVVLSVIFYRPFCKWLCPLGAFYAVMNRVSLFQMRVDTDKCVSCGACARACKMDVDITKTPNHAECIRCGMCIKSCPTKAIHYQYGFGDKADNSKEI